MNSGPEIIERSALPDVTLRADDVKVSVGRDDQLAAMAGAGNDERLRWCVAVARGLRHEAFLLTAERDGSIVGSLPLAFVKTRLFGRFLVSLPFINSAGVVAENPAVARLLIDRAVALADELDVRYLELRHEASTVVEHPALTATRTSKVHMRLALPGSVEALWDSFKPKVRNQIRKGDSANFSVVWGGAECLDDFYAVFSRNMRDLGTPVFGKRLFREILTTFAGDAELCVVRHEGKPAAAALLVHGERYTEVPSASALREFNPMNVNMWMYWQLLQRAAARGAKAFDFGRSTVDSNTFRFKKQWGAAPEAAVWQYYVREGQIDDVRPDNSKFKLMIAVWQKLPVWFTRLIGPSIIRGVP
jgi:FemAB-related protein (PEP-CTERM system-associated)